MWSNVIIYRYLLATQFIHLKMTKKRNSAFGYRQRDECTFNVHIKCFIMWIHFTHYVLQFFMSLVAFPLLILLSPFAISPSCLFLVLIVCFLLSGEIAVCKCFEALVIKTVVDVLNFVSSIRITQSSFINFTVILFCLSFIRSMLYCVIIERSSIRYYGWYVQTNRCNINCRLILFWFFKQFRHWK